jgi:hypothetical protein
VELSKEQKLAADYLEGMSGAGPVGSSACPHDFDNIYRLLVLVRDSDELSDADRGRYLGYCEGVLQEHGYYLSEEARGWLPFDKTLRETYLPGE